MANAILDIGDIAVSKTGNVFIFTKFMFQLREQRSKHKSESMTDGDR